MLPKQCKGQLTEIHNVVPTDCAVIHHNVPGPQCYSIPLEIKNKTSHHTSGPQDQHPNNICNPYITDSKLMLYYVTPYMFILHKILN